MTAKHEAIDELAEARERKEGAEYDAARHEALLRSQAEDIASRTGACPDQMATALRGILEGARKDRDQDPEPRENAELGLALAQARMRAGLSRIQVAKRIDTFYGFVKRLEEGRVANPKWTLLQQYAEVTNSRLRLTLEPSE